MIADISTDLFFRLISHRVLAFMRYSGHVKNVNGVMR